jgi:S-disulfanyl-L-cysteine oxidoreductase SoxD
LWRGAWIDDVDRACDGIAMKKPVTMLLLGAAILTNGCKAGPASRLETSIMTTIKHKVSIGNKNEKNPLQATKENIDAGKQAFGQYCVVCHGLDGQNTGVPFARRMSPPVPSLTSSSVQSYTDGQLKLVIEDGIAPSGMPGSKGILSDQEIWSTVLYIRNLPPAGSLGEPEIYSR